MKFKCLENTEKKLQNGKNKKIKCLKKDKIFY